MLQYHMGWEGDGAGKAAQGKRIRPMLALLFGQMCNLSVENLLPFCSSIELLHNFSLIHDDIEDRDEKRRGRDTLWKIWGIPQAINTGDLLFSLSTKSMLRATGKLPDKAILSAIDQFQLTCNRLTAGQFLDMKFENMPVVAPALYLEMIKGKTAALLGYCTMLAAILAEKSASEIEAYFQFGEALGIAFQIQDDYLGVWGDIGKTGKANHGDLIARKKSYPILLGLANKAEFFNLWNKIEDISERDAEKMANLLENEGVLKLVNIEVKRYTTLAEKIFKSIAPEGNPFAELIFQLTNQLMNRNF